MADLMEFKHSFQTKLIEHRFVPVTKNFSTKENKIELTQNNWYIREENPILYFVSIVDTPDSLQDSAFFAEIDELTKKLDELLFSRIIALEIFIGKRPEDAPLQNSENEHVHKLQWYFDYDTKALEVPTGQPTKLLGIEKFLLSAFDEPPQMSFLKLKNNIKTPYITFSFFLFWVCLLFDGYVSGTQESMIINYGMSNRAITHGEYYRFVTAMFLHADLQHLFSNMIYLYYFGTRLERIYGPVKYLFLYMFCGISASLFSIAFNDVLAIGASGAMYGLLGATLMLVKKFGTRYISMNYATILLLACLGLGIGFLSDNIDNFGHIGGVVAGCCLGITMRDLQTGVITFRKKE